MKPSPIICVVVFGVIKMLHHNGSAYRIDHVFRRVIFVMSTTMVYLDSERIKLSHHTPFGCYFSIMFHSRRESIKLHSLSSPPKLFSREIVIMRVNLFINLNVSIVTMLSNFMRTTAENAFVI